MDDEAPESNPNLWDAENLFDRLWFQESVSTLNLVLRLMLEELRLAEPRKLVEIVEDSAQRKIFAWLDLLLELSEKVIRECEEEEIKTRRLKDGAGEHDGWITADI